MIWSLAKGLWGALRAMDWWVYLLLGAVPGAKLVRLLRRRLRSGGFK